MVGAFANRFGKIVVTSVPQDGIFGGTELAPGQEIISINGTNVQLMPVTSVKAILSSIEGEVRGAKLGHKKEIGSSRRQRESKTEKELQESRKEEGTCKAHKERCYNGIS